MLISLYKCTFMKDIHEQRSAADCLESDAGQEKREREDEDGREEKLRREDTREVKTIEKRRRNGK